MQTRGHRASPDALDAATRPSEHGTARSRRRQDAAAQDKAREHAMWPSPWMRAHWDPLHPLDLNKPIPGNNVLLDSDEHSARPFEPAFAMDLNSLVQSLWTPKSLPESTPSTRSREPTLLRHRSGSPPPPPHPSRQSYDMPRVAPRSVDAYEARSRRQTPPSMDPRQSFDWDTRRRERSVIQRMSYEDPRMSYDAPSRRREPTAEVRLSEMDTWSRRATPSHDYNRYVQSSRRGVAPQNHPYDTRDGYHSDDNAPFGHRREPSRDRDPRPQLRRIASEPPRNLEHRTRRHDRDMSRPPLSQPVAPPLVRMRSEPVLNEDDQSLEI